MTVENVSPALPPLPTSPEKLFEIFQELNIPYNLYHHEAIFTVEQGEKLERNMEGTPCRNLFLRDKKKNMFLVVVPNETPVDLKVLQEKLGCGRLSFGSSERLWQYLGIRAGSVNPFCIINDKDCEVKVVLDQGMMESERVNYHPMDNRMTISITPADLIKFTAYAGNEYEVMNL